MSELHLLLLLLLVLPLLLLLALLRCGARERACAEGAKFCRCVARASAYVKASAHAVRPRNTRDCDSRFVGPAAGAWQSESHGLGSSDASPPAVRHTV
ncbi:hypothetical protein IE81DRAFT_320820 [Ceraceosorus guamensis]|uniref:Extracellular membrane protein CFEM domain-containing protein n=1 Tax=Ceraceosorus guamensis TaxID=1522189 RepID=A0A316W4P6_9BASI|nr:hypothetical protein IE81DRAFT_320820 [Ceraceosorus guamensis]PWN44850.1 hypothetical protein IE81DRAFT_320820 [Ceraceosorus guamensis]